MAVGASAQETGTPIVLGGGWNAGFAGDADVYNFTVVNQYGDADYACNVLAADYPKCIIELEEALPANFQINYMWKASADAEGEATPRYGIAVGDGEKKSVEITFEDGHNYITGVSVQHTDAVEANLVIKKLTLVAKSGGNKIVCPSFTGWAGTDNTTYYRGTVSYDLQYQQLVLKDVIGKKDLTIKVEIAEEATNVQMCVDYEDGVASEWPKFIGKVATFSTKEGAVIKSCGIQYTSEAGSASVEVVGAWIIGTTGVQKIEVLNPANAGVVNAAGQKVDKNYKGLVINKATGKKFINK